MQGCLQGWVAYTPPWTRRLSVSRTAGDPYDAFTFGPARVCAFATARRSPPPTDRSNPSSPPPRSGARGIRPDPPVMMLILLITIDFSRLFFAYISDVNAAREGAYTHAAAHAADKPFDTSAYNQGVYDAATGESNAQGRGGGGALAVAPANCFSPSAPSRRRSPVIKPRTSPGGRAKQVRVPSPSLSRS